MKSTEWIDVDTIYAYGGTSGQGVCSNVAEPDHVASNPDD